MASSEIAICNLALMRIGVTRTLSGTSLPAGGTSAEAAAVNVLYDEVRDQLLAEHPWPFATKWADLTFDDYDLGDYQAGSMLRYEDRWWLATSAIAGETLGVDAPAEEIFNEEFEFAYTLPTDCVKALGLYTGTRSPLESQKIEYSTVAGAGGYNVLVSDYEDPTLKYVAKVETVTQYPPLFTSALAWRLAAELVMPLSLKPDLAAMCMQRAEAEVAKAFAHASSQSQGPMEPDAESIAARS